MSSAAAAAAAAPAAPAEDLFFGGVASLAGALDKTLLLVLRDGKLLLGSLASYDQFGSIILEGARERVCAGGVFADVPVGLLLIRGENIAVIGEIDEALDAGTGALRRVDIEEVHALQEQEAEAAAGGKALGGGAQRLGALAWDFDA